MDEHCFQAMQRVHFHFLSQLRRLCTARGRAYMRLLRMLSLEFFVPAQVRVKRDGGLYAVFTTSCYLNSTSFKGTLPAAHTEV